MNTATIIVIIISIVFIIGGSVFAQYGNKVSDKIREEEMKKQKNR